MLPDRVSNPGPLTYESGALSIALRGPADSVLSRSTIFRLNIYGGCTNQVYFRAGEGTKFM